MKNDSEVTNTFSLFVLSDAKLGNYVIENGIKVFSYILKSLRRIKKEK